MLTTSDGVQGHTKTTTASSSLVLQASDENDKRRIPVAITSKSPKTHWMRGCKCCCNRRVVNGDGISRVDIYVGGEGKRSGCGADVTLLDRGGATPLGQIIHL